MFLVEVLDFNSGQLWVYHKNCFVPATRDFFKSCADSVRATAFPVFFPGLSVADSDGSKDRYMFKDAGLIDNLAMLPFLKIVRRIKQREPLGAVKFWLLSDAGRPLHVPRKSRIDFVGLGSQRAVQRLGVIDRVFRLTGDLAQLHVRGN